MAQVKSVVTKRINALHGTSGARVWQRNYHEHIIRDDEFLNRIREYIANNALRWASDRENPGECSGDPPGCRATRHDVGATRRVALRGHPRRLQEREQPTEDEA